MFRTKVAAIRSSTVRLNYIRLNWGKTNVMIYSRKPFRLFDNKNIFD